MQHRRRVIAGPTLASVSLPGAAPSKTARCLLAAALSPLTAVVGHPAVAVAGAAPNREGAIASCEAPSPPPGTTGARPLFVTVAASLAAAKAALEQAGAAAVRERGGGVLSFVAPRSLAEASLAGVAPDAVVSVDCRGRRHEVPNDPGYISQWALPAVRAPAAWDRTHGSATVVVAVVDSGVDAGHPDLAAKVVPGYDAVRGTDLAPGNTDLAGHGTAVAGVIAAAPNNGGGVAGLGWDTRVAAVKDGDAVPVRSATVAGIRWAADNGFGLINVSSGYPTADQNETDAVAYARSKGAVVVASGGDSAQNGNPVNYPAAAEGVVAVGAVGFDGARAPYSNTGSFVDLVAPGGSSDGQVAHDLHVLAPGGGTTFRAGTSFSAPHVAAAAALVMGTLPTLRPADAVGLLASTAKDLGPPGRDPEYGAGLLDVAAAVAATGTPVRAVPPGPGYRLVASDGGVFAFGDARFLGSTGEIRLAAPIVGSAATPSGDGYWLVASDGGVFAFGDARFLGSTGAIRLARPVVGMAATSSGNGYWLVAADGGVFAFGDAHFLGSTGATTLSRPVVGTASTPSGRGYWLVASDGGIFAFGDARFLGSTGAMARASPVVGMAATRSGGGYWLVASDGGVFGFADAPFLGSTGSQRLTQPMVGIALSA